jgi:Arc/MetJ-type ribon-helix-helix transcriptional regulator
MITLRMLDESIDRVDALVEAEQYASRAAFIVDAINRLVDELEQRDIDRRIVEGYTRIPPTEEEQRWAEISGIESIREEPW